MHFLCFLPVLGLMSDILTTIPVESHSKEFSGNQGKHQNFDLSALPYKFGLILMGMKQKKKKSKWPTQKN